MAQSPIAIYKTYSKSAIHANASTGSFSQVWGSFKFSTAASGVLTLTDSSGNPIDANWIHVQYISKTTAAVDANKCMLLLEPSGSNRTNGNDLRNKYASTGINDTTSEDASGFPGVILFPHAAATSETAITAKDEHTWHFPTGGVSEIVYRVGRPTALTLTGNTHHIILFTYGKEYPENAQAMIGSNGGDNT